MTLTKINAINIANESNDDPVVRRFVLLVTYKKRGGLPPSL